MSTPYKDRFIDFLLQNNALKFGEFLLKSGRKAPYFINTSVFSSGESIYELGNFYAAHILASKITDIDVIFGPAYKGIPLAVATSIALAKDHGKKFGYCFNRKEVKDHGDGGEMVGAKISAGTRTIIVDDVVTAGSTLRESVPLLREKFKADIKGVVVSVDRRERGTSKLSAVDEAAQSLGIKVFPIVTIHEIIDYLSSDRVNASPLNSEIKKKIEQYLDEYGA